MADKSISSSTTSHYEPPFQYSEGKNIIYCRNIKMNLQDIQRLMDKANIDMTSINKDMMKTAKMINLISTKPSADLS